MKSYPVGLEGMKRGVNRAVFVIVAFLLLMMLITVFQGRYPRIGVEGSGFLALGLLAAAVQELAGCSVAWLSLASAGQRVSFPKLLLITTLATSVNSTLPLPAGIPIRVLLQRQVFGTSPAVSASTLILETAVNYTSLALAAACTPLLWPGSGIAIDSSGSSWIWTALLATVLVLATGLLLLSKRARRISRDILRALTGAATRKPGMLAATFLVSAATFPLSMARMALVLHAVGASCKPGPLLTSLVLSRIAGLLSMIPMGLGARDLSLAALLGLAGVPAMKAAAASVLDRLLMTVPYLAGGITGLALLFGGKRGIDSGVLTASDGAPAADEPAVEAGSNESPRT